MRRNRPVVLCIALALGSGVARAETADTPATASAAQPGGPPAATDVQAQAKTHFEAGVLAFDAARYGEAADEFARAYALLPHPDVLVNVAESELRAKRYVESATHFSTYLRQLSPADSAEARMSFAEARKHVGQLTIAAPERATVMVDGKVVGVAPLGHPVFVMPGTHQLQAGPAKRSIIAEAGSELAIRLYPDDLPADATPAVAHPLPIDEWFIQTPVAWAGAGVTVAGLVLSGFAAATANVRYQAANNAKDQILTHFAEESSPRQSPCGPPALNAEYEHACGVYTERRDSGDAWKTTSIVSLVLGVVAAGGTVGYYFWDTRHNSEKTPASIPPQVGFSISGPDRLLTLSGQF